MSVGSYNGDEEEHTREERKWVSFHSDPKTQILLKGYADLFKKTTGITCRAEPNAMVNTQVRPEKCVL